MLELVELVDELGDERLIEQGLAESDPVRIIQLCEAWTADMLVKALLSPPGVGLLQ